MELIPSVEWEGMTGDERPEKELEFERSGREVEGERVLSPPPPTLRR